MLTKSSPYNSAYSVQIPLYRVKMAIVWHITFILSYCVTKHAILTRIDYCNAVSEGLPKFYLYFVL